MKTEKLPSNYENFECVSQVELLSKAEAENWRNLVWLHQENWIPRMNSKDSIKPVFFTLGRAVYLDIGQSENPQETYYQVVLNSNKFLMDVFGKLLERVRLTLQSHLKEPVIYSNDLALPGFHIFFSYGIKIASQNEPHVDMQYVRINWGKKWDSGKAISFTLPLSLPYNGGGLEVWRETIASEEIVHGSLHENYEKHIEEYSVGRLCIQEGMLRHRIAATKTSRIDDERITLQGHGLRFNGSWVLYW